MKNKHINTFMPFLIVGFSIALLIGLFFILANVILWGFLIGCVLWVIITLKLLYQRKFGSVTKKSKHKGIIIEHDQ